MSIHEAAERLQFEIYPTRDKAIERIVTLERELAACAKVLQRLHPIGQVKAIGILECSEALRQLADVCNLCHCCREECECPSEPLKVRKKESHK